MDSVFGIVGDGFVLVAADRTAMRQPLVFKHDEDKIVKLDDTKVMGAAGENCDRVAFTEYITANMSLDRFRTQLGRSCKATAHFIRGELATALRKAPFNVSILLGGVDKAPADASGAGSEAPACEPSLYWIDYMGTMSRVNYGAHGYGAYFTNGLLDRFWKAGMSEAEAVELMGRCLGELKMRFMLNQPNFTCYKISAAGVEAVEVSATSVPDVSGVPAPSEGAAAAAASSSSAAVTA